MSITGMLRTSSSGMAAQSNRLSAVSDNIANVTTTGYKRSYAEFSSFIPTQTTGSYTSGSVSAVLRQAIDAQGSFLQTGSQTDLAVRGDGFLLVSDPDGQVVMTRAGSFVPNGDGDLINAAGNSLMGYSMANGPATIVANSTSGLEKINLAALALQAVPSTTGTFSVNLPADAAVAAGPLPSANAAGATYTNKTSLVAYADLGRPVTLDIYTTKTASETWEISVFDASLATSGGFPYSSGPLVTDTLIFDPVTGALDSTSPTSITIPVPNGSNVDLDLSQCSQLATDYTVVDAKVDGNGPSAVDSIKIDETGVMSAVYENGTRLAVFQIPLAKVPSINNLEAREGDVFTPGEDSGDILIGVPGAGGLGSIEQGSLEQSTVELADELTQMIESERNFQVNSKVFQTASDILEVIVNLKR